MDPFDFFRISTISPCVSVADPLANRLAIEQALQQHPDSDLVLFPELSLSGYSCADLFAQSTLLDACLHEFHALAQSQANHPAIIVVGLPLRHDARIYNVAALLHRGHLFGLVPKQYLPNYKEFYEQRWFFAADGSEPSLIELPHFGHVPFGTDLLFRAGPAILGIEICEDLWMPVPPSSLQAIAGANVLLNLSASNETVNKSSYRSQLVQSQSGRCFAAYAYASCGPSESTTDVVFSGHCLIAENGTLLKESSRVGNGLVRVDTPSAASVDIDLQKLIHDRSQSNTFHESARRIPTPNFRHIHLTPSHAPRSLQRPIAPQPFVPHDNPQRLAQRCREIFEIQCAGLAKRLSILPPNIPLVIGVSGGLDSTLALLVATQTLSHHRWPATRIVGLTMPGFGTSPQSLHFSHTLMQQLGVTAETIDIRPLCMQMFRDLAHQPFNIPSDLADIPTFQKQLEQLPPHQRSDLTFENIQARVRTLLLMNRGFVLGTGDLSEQALGWSTYNGDHMSMYNVNTSIPKTLVRFLVRYVAHQASDEAHQKLLLAIADAPITPELLPLAQDGSLHQATESSVGPYELHDFFLFHMIRNGASPDKIRYLAQATTFSQPYTAETIDHTLDIFLKRFFNNQFKRSCVPDGPKVGSVSLSPRGDWRMPSDASHATWTRTPNPPHP